MLIWIYHVIFLFGEGFSETNVLIVSRMFLLLDSTFKLPQKHLFVSLHTRIKQHVDFVDSLDPLGFWMQPLWFLK